MARPYSVPEPPSFRLTEGTRISHLDVTDGWHLFAGQDGIATITIQIEPGQTGPVPWARVRLASGRISLFNLAQVREVTFADTLPADPGDEGGDE